MPCIEINNKEGSSTLHVLFCSALLCCLVSNAVLLLRVGGTGCLDLVPQSRSYLRRVHAHLLPYFGRSRYPSGTLEIHFVHNGSLSNTIGRFPRPPFEAKLVQIPMFRSGTKILLW